MRAAREHFLQIVFWQLLISVSLASLVWLTAPAAAASALAGGLVFVLANAYGLLRPLPRLGSTENLEFCALFMKAQTGKLILAAAGFALVFGAPWAARAPVPVFGAFALLTLINVAQTSRLSRVLASAQVSN